MAVHPPSSGFVLAASPDGLRRHKPHSAVTSRSGIRRTCDPHGNGHESQLSVRANPGSGTPLLPDSKARSLC